MEKIIGICRMEMGWEHVTHDHVMLGESVNPETGNRMTNLYTRLVVPTATASTTGAVFCSM